MTAPTSAGVAVIVNHTETRQSVRVLAADGQASDVAIGPQQARPLFSGAPLHASVSTVFGRQVVPLLDGAAYRLAPSGVAKTVRLTRIGLGERPGWKPPWRSSAGQPVGPARRTIEVLVCVDEDERTREDVWRDRLSRRIERASAVLRRHTGVALRVAGFRRWDSDDRVLDFVRSYVEFRREVDPPPGQIAIGFSSQYVVERGARRLGGTRGMLRRHVMLKEWSPQVTENDRLQLLLHELGHHFGAAHSAESDSVMRPLLGDRDSRLREVTLRFDVANTLVMALVGDEVRSRGVQEPSQLSASTRRRLAEVYDAIRVTLPEDRAAGIQAQRVGRPLAGLDRGAEAPLAAFTSAAAANSKRPKTAADGEPKRLAGDELATHLIRTAAMAAAADTISPEDLLLSLAVGFDPGGALHAHPKTRDRVKQIDSATAAARRRNVLGKPTARGRSDTLKHFVVMAALAAQLSVVEAEAVGFAKEAVDAQGGTGFSFADLAANRAGIRFAERVLDRRLTLETIASRFDVEHFVPDLDGLPEGLASDEVIERFGGRGDPRFEAVMHDIESRLDALPPYRSLDLDPADLSIPLRKRAVD